MLLTPFREKKLLTSIPKSSLISPVSFAKNDYTALEVKNKIDNVYLGGTVDEIDQLIMNLQGSEGFRLGPMDEFSMRKFRQLKIVVLWLQQEQLFGRYCYYGCYW